MKHSVTAAAALTLVSFCSINAAKAEQATNISASGWKIAASLEKPSFTADEPIFLNVTLTNTTQALLSFPERSPQLEFVVSVKDQSGSAVSSTRFKKGYGELGASVFRVIVQRAKPGGSLVYHFWLNRTFDLTEDGTYTVSVSRDVSSQPAGANNGALITTTPVKFSVVEPHWSDDPSRRLDIPEHKS